MQQGLFGIGEKMGDELIQRAFKQDPGTVTLGDNEVIIPSIALQTDCPRTRTAAV